ncbi:hypothetical protein LTR85_003945 [Meristemomyces frigidus]|nr:hypothetical protein LTR85_003945 [Meristemomyces frigidus]
MSDILHQLLKGVMMHIKEWVTSLLEAKLSAGETTRIAAAKKAAASTRGKKVRKGAAPAGTVKHIIDRRFAVVPVYSSMRVFKQLSAVTQWTGKELKSILRQFMPVYTPLLEEANAPDAIRFVRAAVDFILMAMYKSHDDDTLRYMTLALYRMNQYKEIFRPYRLAKNSAEGDEGHFNFPKFHSMLHYTDFIKWLGNAPDLETGHFEHMHVRYLKSLIGQTNKRKGPNGWEDQLMEHHHRLLNMQSQFDIGMAGRAMTAAEKTEQAGKPIEPTNPVDVRRFFGWPEQLGDRQPKLDTWRTVAEVEELMDALPDRKDLGRHFRQAIAVFVRESRSGAAVPTSTGRSATRDPDAVVRDDSWVLDMQVQFHAALHCYKRTGQDADDSEAIAVDIVRCAPNWQGVKGNGRYDWIWVQEYPEPGQQDTATTEEPPAVPFRGRLPAHLLYVVSIKDDNYVPPSNIELAENTDVPFAPKCAEPVYTGAFVEIYRPRDVDGLADGVYGMTVIKPVPLALREGVL